MQPQGQATGYSFDDEPPLLEGIVFRKGVNVSIIQGLVKQVSFAFSLVLGAAE